MNKQINHPPNVDRFKRLHANLKEPMFVYHWTPKPHFDFISPQIEDLIGYTPSDFMDDPSLPMQIIHPEDKTDDEAAPSPFPLGRMIRLIHRDGHEVWVEIRSVPIDDGAGNIIGEASILFDFSHLKKTQFALEKRLRYEMGLKECSRILLEKKDPENLLNKSLKSLIDNMDVCRIYVFKWFIDPALGPCSSQVAEVCAEGVEPQINSMDLQDIPMMQGFERWVKAFERGEPIIGLVKDFPDSERPVLEEQGILSLLVLPISFSGSLQGFIGFDDTKTFRKWENEDILLLQTVAELIAAYYQRRDAARALFQSESNYRLIVENSVDLIAKMDNEGKFLFVSPSLLKLFGRPETDLIGRKYLTFVHSRDREITRQRIEAVLKPPYTSYLEHRTITAVGWRWLAWTGTAVFNEEGSIDSLIAVGRDISRQKHAEQQLKKEKKRAEISNAAKSQFLSNISHELRTPLTAIIGLADIISSQLTDESSSQNVDLIVSESETMLDMVNDILDHSKLESEKFQLVHMPFSFETLIEEITNLYREQFEQKGIELEVVIDPAIPDSLVGASKRIRQVLRNIIGNALKFTEEGKVSLEAQLHGESTGTVTIFFEVVDTGIGIPAEHHKEIFESFVQLDEGATRKYGGTGLGTTIAKQLVELMNGKIWVDSEPGRGSTFHFTIRLEKSKDDHVGDLLSDIPVKKTDAVKKRILLAEDYPPTQHILISHLKSKGYQVILAENGKEAVEQACFNPFDLIIMDVQMPEMDGYEATRQIRDLSDKCAETPILALTATTYMSELDKCLSSGMNDVITKPIRKNELLKIAAKWIFKKSGSKTEISDQPLPSISRNLIENESVLDLELIQKDFGPDAYRLLNMLAQYVAKQLSALKTAIEEKDLSTIRFEAHSIKSGAAFYSAGKLASLAGLLEESSKEADWKNCRRYVKQIDKAYQSLIREIEILNNGNH